ncbi:hypothetical protein IL306_003464 [Fusarium sp. DS 682]|nr:hypothetical protein IL306_003464 [Fusarium sp. DS 682]
MLGIEETPLELAATLGFDKTVEILLDLCTIDSCHAGKGIVSASMSGQTTIASFLRNYPDSQFQRALELAAGRGRTSVVRLLLDRQVTKDVQRALDRAVDNGQTSVARLLIDRLVTNDIQRALNLAAGNGRTSVVSLLLDRQGANHDSALAAAIKNNHKDVVQELLRRGSFDSRYIDSDGHTLLSLGAAEGNLSAFIYFHSKGWNMNREDGKGRVPLWYAILNDRQNIIQFFAEQQLVSPQAIIELFSQPELAKKLESSSRSKTLLSWAVRWKIKFLVVYLVEHTGLDLASEDLMTQWKVKAYIASGDIKMQ